MLWIEMHLFWIAIAAASVAGAAPTLECSDDACFRGKSSIAYIKG